MNYRAGPNALERAAEPPSEPPGGKKGGATKRPPRLGLDLSEEKGPPMLERVVGVPYLEYLLYHNLIRKVCVRTF